MKISNFDDRKTEYMEVKDLLEKERNHLRELEESQNREIIKLQVFLEMYEFFGEEGKVEDTAAKIKDLKRVAEETKDELEDANKHCEWIEMMINKNKG